MTSAPTLSSPPALRLSLRNAERRDRNRIDAVTRAVGLFRDDEIPVALEVFDAAVSDTSLADDRPYAAVVAERDGEVAGWICWGPTPCTLGTYDMYWLAVDPASHGGGIGTALVDEMERRLAGTARLIVVETAGRPDYAGTRAFYEARGYRRTATIPDFYAPDDDQVVYVKSCTPIADSQGGG